MERHVALFSLAEIGHRVLGPLVRFGQQHAAGIVRIDISSDFAEKRMGFRQVLAVGSFALEEIRNGVQTQPVHAHRKPVFQHLKYRFPHLRIVVIQVGLMAVEAMPIVSLGHGIPGPVGGLEILEDNAGLLVFLGHVAPDVVVAVPAPRFGPPRPLKPGMLVGRVVDDQFRNHFQSPAVRGARKTLKSCSVP